MPTYSASTVEMSLNNVRATMPMYINGYIDNTVRMHVLLNMMKQWGTIITKAGSSVRKWQIKVRSQDVRVKRATSQLTFQNSQLYEQCEIGTRAIEATDMLLESDWKENQGDTQLIDLLGDKMKTMNETLGRRLSEYLVHDGDSADYLESFNGFESCLADDGNTVVGDRYALPSDTYAGQSTALANFGGIWNDQAGAGAYNTQLSDSWPHGVGSDEYDANSPLLVNWSSAAWGTSSNEWIDNCEIVVRETSLLQKTRTGAKSGMLFMMPVHMMTDAMNFYSGRYRIYQPFGGGDMGYSDTSTILVDGAMIHGAHEIPLNTFYGLHPDLIEAFFFPITNLGDGPNRVGADSMIDCFGPDWVPTEGAWVMRANSFGNLRMRPRNMVKGKNYASA